jgi:mannose-6-phosphate isomerase-like protein (cupin superfamily)
MTRSATATDRPTGPFDLSTTPIHLGSQVGADHRAAPILGFGHDESDFEEYVAKYCTPDAPGRLVMAYTSPTHWRAWECHPAGDELVIVLEGKGTFIQEIGGTQRRTAVGPGCTIINPAGVWHTADVDEPLKAIYITPCPGTQHRTR